MHDSLSEGLLVLSAAGSAAPTAGAKVANPLFVQEPAGPPELQQVIACDQLSIIKDGAALERWIAIAPWARRNAQSLSLSVI